MTTSAQAAATSLTARQQALATISAYTAPGNLTGLHDALVRGFEAGLTVNEEKLQPKTNSDPPHRGSY